MADRIKGITVEIGGDTVGLQRALQEVNKQTRSIQSELKDVERLLKFDPGNTEALAQKQQLLQRAVENTSLKLNELRLAEENVTAQFERGDLPEAQYRAFQREIQFTARQLQNYQRRLEETNAVEHVAEAEVKSLATKFREAGTAVAGVGKKFKEAGDGIKEAGEKAMPVTEGLLALGGASVASAVMFDNAGTQMQNSLGITADKASQLQDVATNVWKLGFGEDLNASTEAVSNLYATLGDIPDAEMGNLSRQLLTISKTFQTDLPANVSAMHSVMSIFGKSAQDSLDMITYAEQHTSGVFRADLTDAVQEMNPLFKSMGMDAETSFGYIIQASQSGIENFDVLSSLTSTFMGQLTAGGKSVDQAFSTIGGNAEVMWKKFQEGHASAWDVFQATTKQLSTMKDGEDKLNAGGQLFGDYWNEASEKAVEGLGGATTAMKGFGGSATEASDVAQQSFGQQLSAVLRGLGTALQPLGGVILDLAQRYLPTLQAGVASLVTWFQSLSDKNQNLVVIFGAIIAAIPPIIVVIGTLVGSIGSIITGIGAVIGFVGTFIGWLTSLWGVIGNVVTWVMNLARFLPMLGTALEILTGPIGWVILAITALIAIGIAVYKNWDLLGKKASELGAWIKNAFNDWIAGVKQRMNQSKQDVISIWNGVMNFFKGIDLGAIGRNVMQGFLNGISGMASKIWNKAKEIADGVGKWLSKALHVSSPSKITMEIGKNVGEGLIVGMNKTISGIKNASNNLASHTVGGLKNANTGTNINNAKTITVQINSPKALDVREANRAFNQTMKQMALQW